MNNTIKFVLLGIFTCAAFTILADGESTDHTPFGRFTISAGPAWRGHAKLGIKGTAFNNPLRSSNKVTEADPQNSANWNLESVPSPVISDPDPVWATMNRREIYSSKPGDRSIDLDSSCGDLPHGYSIKAGVDFWNGEIISLGIGFRFTDFAEIETSTHGTLHPSMVRHQAYSDGYYFLDDIWTGDPDLDLDWAPDGSKPQREPYKSDRLQDTGWQSVMDGRTVSARLRSELRQFGFGPSFTWHVCRWVDISAEADYLLCYARNHFEADGMKYSGTDYLNGFGCTAELAVNITDWLAVFGRWGYEWIEKNEFELGTFKAEIDYSSCVTTAGVLIRF